MLAVENGEQRNNPDDTGVTEDKDVGADGQQGADVKPTDEEFGEQGQATQKLLKYKIRKENGEPPAVLRSDLEDSLRETLKQRQAFLKLPFTLLFFIVFVLSVLSHEQVPNSSLVQREFRGMLSGTTFEGIAYTSGHKDLSDIDTKEDVWTYLKEVIVPLFINPLSFPAADRYRVLRYNQLVGGVQIQQVRRQEVDCSEEYPDLGPHTRSGNVNPIIQGIHCYPWYTEDDRCFGTWNTSDPSEIPMGFCTDSSRETAIGFSSSSRQLQGRRLDFVPDGGGTGGASKGARLFPTRNQLYSFFALPHEGLEKSVEKVQERESNGWIDQQTAWVGIRILVLNPDLAMFVHTTVHVYFSPSGALLPHITAQSFQPEPYQYMSVIGLDIAWVVLLCVHSGQVLREVYISAKNRRLSSFLCGCWHWIDALVIFGGVVILLLWLIYLDKLVGFKRSLMNARAAAPDVGFTSDLYPVLAGELHFVVSEISDYLMVLRLIFAVYTLLIALKMLESFSAQPRLALVTNTLANAGADLFHFMIVLFIIFMSYVTSGMFLFGRRLWSFSSIQYSMATCFRMALGDFSWEELGEEHPITAALWFWSYIVVMTLLMLNMLMAIIMDEYTNVKCEAANSLPIWTQVGQLINEKFRRSAGSAVSAIVILDAVGKMMEEEVTEEVLITAVPSMNRDQAKFLVESTETKVLEELTNTADQSMSETMKMTGLIAMQCKKIGWRLEEILEEEQSEQEMIQEQFRGGPYGSDPSHGLKQDVFDIDAMDPSYNQALALPRDMYTDEPYNPEGPFVAQADLRIGNIEKRIAQMDEFVQQAFDYTTYRGKDLKNRLAVIEDLIRSQRDLTQHQMDDSVWEQQPMRLGPGVGNEIDLDAVQGGQLMLGPPAGYANYGGGNQRVSYTG